MLRSTARRAGHPLDEEAPVIRPRAEGEAPRSSISRDSDATHPPSTGEPMDEAYAAAVCRHAHGDPRQSDDERAAHKGMADLFDRSRSGPKADLSRDERRLMRRYAATIDAVKAADIAAWRACTVCSGPT